MAHSITQKLLFASLSILSFAAKAEISTIPFITIEKDTHQIEVLDYDIARDYEAIKQILKDNWSVVSTDPFFNEKEFEHLFLDCQSGNRPGMKTTVKVIRVNGQIAGAMSFVPGNYGMVEILAVDAKFRNMGLGYQLLAAAQELAQKLKANGLELYVLAHNTPAINLYKKFGFIQEANIGNNICLMAKSFTQPPTQFVCGTCERFRVA